KPPKVPNIYKTRLKVQLKYTLEQNSSSRNPILVTFRHVAYFVRDGRRLAGGRKGNSHAHHQTKPEAGEHSCNQHPSSRLLAPGPGIVRSRAHGDARRADDGIWRGGSKSSIVTSQRGNCARGRRT